MPRLSFIVVAYENPSTLRTCLSSLLDQTMRDFEIIVVDNSIGSTWIDLNKDLCRMSDRIRYEWTADRTDVSHLRLRHSNCLYTATEIGAELAIGDFLCFPSQDSYYVPVFAERMISAAGRHHCDLVYCGLVHGLPDRHYVPIEPSCRVGQADKGSFILRRSLFTGFPDKRLDYEKADGLLIERLAQAGVTRRRLDEYLMFHS
jgi:glycosyltransferase involved in cell wall biosynthesis